MQGFSSKLGSREVGRSLFCANIVLGCLLALALCTGPSWGEEIANAVCLKCHSSWLDNDPQERDVTARNAEADYLPLSLGDKQNPFYTIGDGYEKSIHSKPAFAPSASDFVKCVDCHGGPTEAHKGMGGMPTSQSCGNCHTDPFFDFESFARTPHANPDGFPGKFFDQPGTGQKRASTLLPTGEAVTLLKGNGTPVKRAERVEECSVCHNYALQHKTLSYRIRTPKLMPQPEVGCPACHQAHVPGPDANHIPTVSTTVKVEKISGSTVLQVSPSEGRPALYVNHRAYKVNSTGAQDFFSGKWTRGSSLARPLRAIVEGRGTLDSTSQRLTFPQGGFSQGVKRGQTVVLSAQAVGSATLPSDAVNAGQTVQVRATLEGAGFEVEEVVDDHTILVKPGVIATASVTYRKSSGGTGSLPVRIPFQGEVEFQVKDMYTNTESLCASCHTKGNHKYTRWGRKPDGSLVDLSMTHNADVMTQYLTSGHANRMAPPFEEFSARSYGSTHQPTYPFDMSIPGTGGVGSLRNRGNTTFELVSTPDPNTVYLVTGGNTTQPVLINNYVCNQCHHGLGSIDYQEDKQGTEEARVLWGDATVTCITCHDPHEDKSKNGKLIRIPKKLSYNSRFVDPNKNPRGGIDRFMDGSEIPEAVGDGKICLFCHQGRESGLTVYMAIKAANPNLDPYANPDQTISSSGVSFVNPHYLDGGAILWSKNAWEYFFGGSPQMYSSGNLAHQSLNCMGCHMGEANEANTEGGHTFRPRIETCQGCHGPVQHFTDVRASADYDGNGLVETVFKELGTINPDTGLFGQLKAVLESKGIYYNPDVYPYFFTASGAQFRAWTPNTLSAAFNLAYAYKAGGAVYAHNAKYIVQILQDSLRALGVVPSGVRPLGERPATDYRTVVVNP
jgi:hypothetical protein